MKRTTIQRKTPLRAKAPMRRKSRSRFGVCPQTVCNIKRGHYGPSARKKWEESNAA